MGLISRLPGGGSSKHKATGGTLKGATSYPITWDFVPNYVCLFVIGYENELRTPCIVYERDENGTWDYIGVRQVHNYYSGSGGDDMAWFHSINDEGCIISTYSKTHTFVWEAWQ